MICGPYNTNGRPFHDEKPLNFNLVDFTDAIGRLIGSRRQVG
jgi:hypothetical protein